MNQKVIDEWNKKIAAALDITPEEVDRLAKFQFAEFKEATHTCSTLELTEIGSFSINKKKYYGELERKCKMIKAYQKQLSNVKEEGRLKKSLESKLKSAQADFDFLKDKIKNNEMETNTGGMAQSSDAS